MDKASKIVAKSRAVFGVRLKAVLMDWVYVASITPMESSACRKVDTAAMVMDLLEATNSPLARDNWEPQLGICRWFMQQHAMLLRKEERLLERCVAGLFSWVKEVRKMAQSL